MSTANTLIGKHVLKYLISLIFQVNYFLELIIFNYHLKYNAYIYIAYIRNDKKMYNTLFFVY